MADALGCPKGTVTSRIRRGLESLQASVQVYGASAAALLPLLAEESAAATPEPQVLIDASRALPNLHFQIGINI